MYASGIWYTVIDLFLLINMNSYFNMYIFGDTDLHFGTFDDAYHLHTTRSHH